MHTLVRLICSHESINEPIWDWLAQFHPLVSINRHRLFSPYIPQCCYSIHLAYNIIHYCDVILGVMAYQITGLTTVYSAVHSRADQRTRQSSASMAFVRGIHRWLVSSPHKWPVTQKMFPFDDVIFGSSLRGLSHSRLRRHECSPLVANKLLKVFDILGFLPLCADMIIPNLVYSLIDKSFRSGSILHP